MPPDVLLFHDVLRDLKNRDSRYLKNWYVFVAMPPDKKLRWIEHIKTTAKTGLPFSTLVLSEVVKRRMS